MMKRLDDRHAAAWCLAAAGWLMFLATFLALIFGARS